MGYSSVNSKVSLNVPSSNGVSCGLQRKKNHLVVLNIKLNILFISRECWSLVNWKTTDSSKLWWEINDNLCISDEGSVSRQNWVESEALQFAKWPPAPPYISQVSENHPEWQLCVTRQTKHHTFQVSDHSPKYNSIPDHYIVLRGGCTHSSWGVLLQPEKGNDEM